MNSNAKSGVHVLVRHLQAESVSVVWVELRQFCLTYKQLESLADHSRYWLATVIDFKIIPLHYSPDQQFIALDEIINFINYSFYAFIICSFQHLMYDRVYRPSVTTKVSLNIYSRTSIQLKYCNRCSMLNVFGCTDAMRDKCWSQYVGWTFEFSINRTISGYTRGNAANISLPTNHLRLCEKKPTNIQRSCPFQQNNTSTKWPENAWTGDSWNSLKITQLLRKSLNRDLKDY